MTKIRINLIFTHVMTHKLFVCSKINDSFILNTAYYYKTVTGGCICIYTCIGDTIWLTAPHPLLLLEYKLP